MQRETDLGQYIGKKGSDTRGLERWKRQRLSVGWICVVLGQVLGKETQGFSEQPGWIPRQTRLGSLRKAGCVSETSECTCLGKIQSAGW